MSVIAGIHALDPDARVPGAFADELRSRLSRREDASVFELSNGRTVFFGSDAGGLRGDWVFAAGSSDFSMIAGETLQARPASPPDRGADLREIHNDIANGRTDTLKRCRGTFAIVSAQRGSLSLIADKLGVRQLFYWIGDDFVVFASALRIIESLGFIKRRLNLRGVIEHLALGYPLADRTPYESVFAMRAGEVLQFRDRRTLRCRYWKWDEFPPSEQPKDVLLDRLFGTFRDAVRMRLGSDRGTIAYLSGGLDSRCVVSALQTEGAAVHTFNFARPGTKDLVYGARFADAAGTIHNEFPKEAGDDVPDYSAKIAAAWYDSPTRDVVPVERANVVWSGEGGSVALGHVHFARRIAELVREREIDAAIELFFERESIHLSPKIFRREFAERPIEMVRQGIREEMAQFASCDPARNFYLFLMLNDQRRKLHSHFENIDVHRIEFQLPFFDAEFLRAVLEVPSDLCFEHALYVDWLSRFPTEVRSVPWQSYPGHVTCPVADDTELADQWGSGYRRGERKVIAAKLRREAREILTSPHFPSEILRRSGFRVAYMLHRSGLRDYGYLIATAATLERFARNCVR